MGWIDRIVDREVKTGVERVLREKLPPLIKQAMQKAIDERIGQIVQNQPMIKFIKAAQMEMLRVDPSMDIRLAWFSSRDAINNFLKDEGIKFGDDGYDWSPGAAVDLIQDIEISHWKSKA